MAMRINNNIDALTVHHSLNRNDRILSKVLQRLSTGLKINSSADDPAGLVISEQMRAQIVGLTQAVENSQKDSNLLGTAEGALNEVNGLLESMRQLAIHAANTATVDAEQLSADQSEIDSALRSIDRIANATKYGKKYLLNGSQGYTVSNNTAGAETLIDVHRVVLSTASQITVTMDYITSAQQVSANLVPAASTTNLVLAIQGVNGVDYITVASNASIADIQNAINNTTANTGVYASGNAVHTVGYGSKEWLNISVIQGDGWSELSGVGQDGVAVINGTTIVGDGLNFRVDDGKLKTDIILSAGTNTGASAVVFSVTGGGMLFQLGERTKTDEQANFGIRSINSVSLGRADIGWLNQLRTGNTYDLFKDPQKAVKIIDAAISQIAATRARLGAFISNTLESNVNSLNVAIENITDSESRIRDANIATEVSDLSKYQILVQAGTAMLAQANVSAQSVLQLLQ